MKTKLSIKLIFLFPILGLLLFAFFLFGLFILYKTISEPEFIGFIAGFMFLWMSIGFISVLSDELRSFEIINRTLIIRKILTGKIRIFELSKIRFNDYDWGEINWTKLNGILIQYKNDRPIQINKANFRNSDEFIDLIKESCMIDETIRPKFDYKKLKVFAFFGLIILILLGIYKWIQ